MEVAMAMNELDPGQRRPDSLPGLQGKFNITTDQMKAVMRHPSVVTLFDGHDIDGFFTDTGELNCPAMMGDLPYPVYLAVVSTLKGPIGGYEPDDVEQQLIRLLSKVREAVLNPGGNSDIILPRVVDVDPLKLQTLQALGKWISRGPSLPWSGRNADPKKRRPIGPLGCVARVGTDILGTIHSKSNRFKKLRMHRMP